MNDFRKLVEVLILDKGNLKDAIKWLSPKFLVLGKEFEKERHWQMIEPLKMLEKNTFTHDYFGSKLALLAQCRCALLNSADPY